MNAFQEGLLTVDAAATPEPVDISENDRLKMKRLGFAYWRAGKLKEAARYLAVVLSLDPQDNQALHVAALIAGQQGRHEDALTLMRLVVDRQPNPARHNDFGLKLARLGRHVEAVGQYREAIKLDNDDCPALNNMAMSLAALQRFELAEATYKLARTIRPEDHRIIINFAGLLNNRGRHAETLAMLEGAIAACDDPDEALVLRGLRERTRGRYGEALELYRAREKARPGDHHNLEQMGVALQMLDRAPEAEALYRRIIAARPDASSGHAALSTVLAELGRMDEALASADRAVELSPHEPDLQHRRAHFLISMGRYEEGWAAYDARLRSRQADNLQRLWNDWTPWAGEPIGDSAMLVLTEQGIGDTVQFLRYLPLVARRAGRLTVYTTAALRSLVSEIPGVAEVRVFGEPIPPHDVHAHIMSLPRAFGTTLDTIPDHVPYVAVRPDRTDRWGRRVDAALEGRRPGVRVGIVWAGNPGFGNDFRRSMPFASILPLFKVPGVHWFSLQVGGRASDPAEVAPNLLPTGGLHALLEGTPDLTETAGLLANLDLVLAVDTGVAHLAGALARPVWLMTAAAADWRWMRNRETTPWYPTMRLFRQGQDCSWGPVVERIAAALLARVTTGNAPAWAAE